MSRYVLLSFDVEEFDIPLEYKQTIDLDEQMETGRIGLDALMPVINMFDVECTMFTTANYAMHFPGVIKEIAKNHEIASHAYYHSYFEPKHLLQSKETLERITETKVTGFRMLRMGKVNVKEVAEAGYIYDSSINPTLLPGRYNNLHLPRTLYTEENIFRMPVSVSPVFRLPLFWLAFKNYPYWLFRNLCLQCIKKDGYVSLYFHPWEFADIKKYHLPGYIKNFCGVKMVKRLRQLISDLKKDCEFITIQEFINKKG